MSLDGLNIFDSNRQPSKPVGASDELSSRFDSKTTRRKAKDSPIVDSALNSLEERKNHLEQKVLTKGVNPLNKLTENVRNQADNIGDLSSDIIGFSSFISEVSEIGEVGGIDDCVKIGFSIYNYLKGKKTINEDSKRLFEIEEVIARHNKELDEEIGKGDYTNIERVKELTLAIVNLQDGAEEYKKKIEGEIANNSDALKMLIFNGVNGGTNSVLLGFEISTEFLKEAELQKFALGLATNSLTEFLSVLTLVMSSKAVHKCRKNIEVISREKSLVSKKLKSAKAEIDLEGNYKNRALVTVLELRLRNLEHQSQNNLFEMGRNILSLTGGAVGSVSTIGTLAIVLGANLGAGLAATVTATGIGALVIGAAAMTVGGGYFIYKKKHSIVYLKDSVVTSAQSIRTNYSIGQLMKKQQSLLEKQSVIVKEKEKSGKLTFYATDLTRQLESINKDIENKANLLQRINEAKTKAFDIYKYSRDAANFGEGEDGTKMTETKMREASEIIYDDINSYPVHLKAIGEFFEHQNTRLNLHVSTALFKGGGNWSNNSLWKALMAGLTAPAKR